jgi:hypothetical protein
VVSTDGIRGGSSTATIDIAGDAAVSGRGYLRIQGKIAEGFAYPWAGAAFWPGGAPMAAVNLSRFKELVFKARGDGGSVNVLAFAESLGPVPAIQTFTAGAEWKEIVIPFSAFKGMDGSDFQGLVFCAGVGRQSFWFGIDDVRLR